MKVLDDIELLQSQVGVLNDERGYLVSKNITGMDLNNIVENGKYWGNQLNNMPSGVDKLLACTLEVTIIESLWHVRQVLRCDSGMFERWKSDSWQEWRQIATTEITDNLSQQINVLNGLVNGAKVYKSLSDLEITQVTSIVNVVAKMQNNSVLITDNISLITEQPIVSWGQIVIFKTNNNRNSIKFYSQEVSTGKYYEQGGSVANGLFTGWQQIATTTTFRTVWSGNVAKGASLTLSESLADAHKILVHIGEGNTYTILEYDRTPQNFQESTLGGVNKIPINAGMVVLSIPDGISSISAIFDTESTTTYPIRKIVKVKRGVFSV